MIEKNQMIEKLDRTDALLREAKYAEAIVLLKEIHEDCPDEEPVLLRLAWASWDHGDKDGSIACWETLLDRELERKIFTGFAYDELVRIYKQENKVRELIIVCEKAVGVQPLDAALLEELGRAYLQSGLNDKAGAVFQKLTEMEEDNPVFHCGLGEALFAAGRTTESEAAYTRAAGIDREQSDRYYFKIADLFSRSGRPAEAKRLLEKCIDVNPSHPIYRSCLGDEMIRLGKLDDAQRAYETAAGLDAGNAGTYYNRMGHTLMKEKLFGRAAAAFQKAIDCEALPPYHRSLARALSEMEHPSPAPGFSPEATTVKKDG